MLSVSSQTNFSIGLSTADCQFKNPVGVGVLVSSAQYILINSIIVPLGNIYVKSLPCFVVIFTVDKIIK